MRRCDEKIVANRELLLSGRRGNCVFDVAVDDGHSSTTGAGIGRRRSESEVAGSCPR